MQFTCSLKSHTLSLPVSEAEPVEAGNAYSNQTQLLEHLELDIQP